MDYGNLNQEKELSNKIVKKNKEFSKIFHFENLKCSLNRQLWGFFTTKIEGDYQFEHVSLLATAEK